MKKYRREDLRNTFMGSTGWLFADLLLALAMLFLIANTVPLPKSASPKAQAEATATAQVQATATALAQAQATAIVQAQATATAIARPTATVYAQSVATALAIATASANKAPIHLEQSFHRFTITIDQNLLLNNDPQERKRIFQQIKSQKFLINRRAGLIVAYGGAPTDNDISTAFQIADDIYSIVQDLGKSDSTFSSAAKYDHLYTLGVVPSIVQIDIFLFAQ